MRILLDECIDESLRHWFASYACETCRYAGLRGLSNGQLLSAAEKAGYDVLITVDRNMAHQQNLRRRTISLIILQPRTTNLEDLVTLVPMITSALEALHRGEAIFVSFRNR